MPEPEASPRTVAEAITTALQGRPDIAKAYVSASAPDWAEVYIHVDGGKRFYLTVLDDSEYD